MDIHVVEKLVSAPSVEGQLDEGPSELLPTLVRYLQSPVYRNGDGQSVGVVHRHSPVLDRKKPGGVEVDVADCTEDINIAVMEGIEPANDTMAIMVKGDQVLLHVLFLCQEAIMLLADNAVLVVQKIICLLGIGQLLQNVDICPSCWTALVDRRRFLVQYLIALRSCQSSFCLLERVMLDVVNDDIVLGTHVSYHLLRHIFNCGVGSGHWFTA